MDDTNNRNRLPDVFPVDGKHFLCGGKFLVCPRCGRIPSHAFRNDAPTRPHRAEWWSAMLKCNCGVEALYADIMTLCWFVCRFCQFGQKERKFGKVIKTQTQLKCHTTFKCHQKFMEATQQEEVASTPALSHTESPPGSQLLSEQLQDHGGVSANSYSAKSADPESCHDNADDHQQNNETTSRTSQGCHDVNEADKYIHPPLLVERLAYRLLVHKMLNL